MSLKDLKIKQLQKRCNDLIKINEELQEISIAKDLNYMDLNKALATLQRAIKAEINSIANSLHTSSITSLRTRLQNLAAHCDELAAHHDKANFLLTERQNNSFLGGLLPN